MDSRAFMLAGALFVSENGGLDFTTVARDIHSDHQAMWIDPLRPRRVLSGSDCRWQIINDGGKNLKIVNTFPFTPFCHIPYDLQSPNWVCARYTRALQRLHSPYSNTCSNTEVVGHEFAPKASLSSDRRAEQVAP